MILKENPKIWGREQSWKNIALKIGTEFFSKQYFLESPSKLRSKTSIRPTYGPSAKAGGGWPSNIL